jgi:hypothetical protein
LGILGNVPADLSGGDVWKSVYPNAIYAILRQMFAVATKTANYPLTDNDYIILGDATAGAIEITLPDGADQGKAYFIQKIDAGGNKVKVLTSGADTFLQDGSSEYDLNAQWSKLLTICDGAGHWLYIIV